MTITDFFGCACLAFGPPLAMFTLTIAVEPIRVIILIVSAFFWLISLLLSSAIWYTITPLQNQLAFGIIYSVILQEVFRYFLYRILRKAETGLEKVTTAHVADSRHVFAYVCGLGFGVMSGSFALVNVLADAVGPGTMGLRQGTEYFFIISAATTLAFILLHTFWGVIFFAGFDNKNRGQLIWVIVSHLVASNLTLLNGYKYHAASIVSLYIILAITAAIAFKVVGGRVKNIAECFKK